MGAQKLRLVGDTIELDSPEEGLESTLNEIARDLEQVGQVRRDVRSWALAGAAASSLVTVLAIAGLFFAFMPGPVPPAIVINPAPIAVVVTQPAPVTAAPTAGAAKPAAAAKPAEELPPVSEIELAVRRSFRALWASRPRAALTEAEAVLAAEPNHVDALAAQAFALFELRKDKAARAVVKKALKLNPKHPLANVLRGTMAQVDHDVGSALAHYEKYLRQRPSGALSTELLTVRTNLTPSP